MSNYLTEDVYEKAFRLLCEEFLKRREVDPQYEADLKRYEELKGKYDKSRRGLEGTSYSKTYINNDTGKTRDIKLKQSKLSNTHDKVVKLSDMDHLDMYVTGRDKYGFHDTKSSDDYKQLDQGDLRYFNDWTNNRVVGKETEKVEDPNLRGVVRHITHADIMNPTRNAGFRTTKTVTTVEPFPSFKDPRWRDFDTEK